jgi:hypothetical protein
MDAGRAMPGVRRRQATPGAHCGRAMPGVRRKAPGTVRSG